MNCTNGSIRQLAESSRVERCKFESHRRQGFNTICCNRYFVTTSYVTKLYRYIYLVIFYVLLSFAVPKRSFAFKFIKTYIRNRFKTILSTNRSNILSKLSYDNYVNKSLHWVTKSNADGIVLVVCFIGKVKAN